MLLVEKRGTMSKNTTASSEAIFQRVDDVATMTGCARELEAAATVDLKASVRPGVLSAMPAHLNVEPRMTKKKMCNRVTEPKTE